MALCEVRFYSESLRKHEAMNVILPDKPSGRLPVLYLLHGLSDDHTRWCRQTSIERYATGRRMIVVMPDTHRLFYVNDPRPCGFAYEDHIVRDVVGFVDRTFPTIHGRHGRAVAGLSMGGYGALMLALRNPGRFATAVSHSGALMFAHDTAFMRDGEEYRDVAHLADSLPGREYDLWQLAENHARGGRKLALRLDCGTEDRIIEHTRAFHAHLDALGIEHEYAEHPGGHEWSYWDEHVVDTLRFVTKHTRSR